jgi:DNA-binding transcriptional LysR family regulator
MDRLDAIRLFVRVVESGNFSAAARAEGVGQPAVSKQIAALESSLGAQLMRRTSRNLTLTEAGQTFYESAIRLIDDFDALATAVGRGQSQPSGLLRITVAPVFGRLYVVPRLPEFHRRYPGIAIEVSTSDRRVNLVEEGIDLALRHGEIVDATLVARKLVTVPFVTVATPAYLKKAGTPKTPADLQRHDCASCSIRQEVRAWEYRDVHGPIVHLPQSYFRTSDAEQLRAAVLAGFGIAHAPQWIFAPEIASGQLKVLLKNYECEPQATSAVYPSGRRLPTKVRVFIDFLLESFEKEALFAM